MITATDWWRQLLRRLGQAVDSSERLAVAASCLSDHEQDVKVGLRVVARDVVDSVLGTDVEVDALLKTMKGIQTDRESSMTLLRLVASLDRSHSKSVDLDNETAAEPKEFWGPYGFDSDGLTFLLRWPRAVGVSADQQSLLSLAMRHHRILSPRHGGIQWELGAMGVSSGRRAVIRGLLSRKAWPIGIAVWPGMGAKLADFDEVGNCIVVDPVGDEANAIQRDVFAAIDFAVEAKAQVLLLPELYVPRASMDAVRQYLAKAGEAVPVMTVMGLSHLPSGDMWINEAVVLDYSGEELWKHRKLSPFVGKKGVGECLAVGAEVRLNSSPMGWIATLICLDLFAPLSRSALLAAAPNLVLIPSLSSKTSAHGNALTEASAFGIACVVANQTLDAASVAAPSLHSLGGAVETILGPTILQWDPRS